jgi:putative MATE family efflux protein
MNTGTHSTQIQPNKSQHLDNPILSASIFRNFFSLVIPSLVGLVAFSSASIVDGIFIGNYVGTSALAAINLIIPLLNFIFGIAFMLSIGGSVSAGKYIGENNIAGASSIFSKIMIVGIALAITVTTLSLIFEDNIFNALGSTEALKPLMSDYFRISVAFLVIDIMTIGLYYFVRIDGKANLAAAALLILSISNMILDYVFIVQFQWGLKGAALATGLAQTIACAILFIYFLTPFKKIRFRLFQKNWLEVFRSCYNGLSEFINEVSISIVAFILNWILITEYGENGVAAITIINYLLMMGIMIIISVSEAGQIFISQNFGAKNYKRITQYFLLSIFACLCISVFCISLLLGYTPFMIELFLDESTGQAAQLATTYVSVLWPIFLFNSFTIMISAYFTGMHKARESSIIALLRSLILPCGFLALFYYWIDSMHFLWALPVAEGLTFITAIILLYKNLPKPDLVPAIGEN